MATGVAQHWNDDENTWTLNLPFAFPFYGINRTSVNVSPNGQLTFGSSTGSAYHNSDANLKANARIAVLWDDPNTSNSPHDVFVDTSVAGQIKIRWAAVV